ncbi:MAG TPA: VCBS repeat-containing protein [Candidatus Acutalibacter pullistercoris]|uniref:VCBS repeat-containing protein n=1 Tax=Candidatus Acutalibacter pullistercoris TaxID=2838418 RepID=A0A9D1YD26_9FIRM|nr:VCBS repeat-containing protein [Candidatus Acutalibacter pullistercoris]
MGRRLLRTGLGLLLCLCLSGCSFSMLDAQNLMAPPKANADQQSIHQLLQGDRTEMTLVYPKNGEYRSAIITKDFTGDGSKDALGFYALEDRSVAVQFLLKDGDAWRTAATFQNTATQVDRVCFADLNGDGRQDVLIGWGSTAGTTGRTAAVSAYLFSEGEITEYPLGTYGEMAVTDFDGDGVDEVFTIDKYLPPEGEEGEASPAMARVYRFVDGQVRAVASVEADNSITNYTALSFGKLSAQLPGVAVDGAKADGSMTTQLFFFDGQGSLQNLPEGVNGENYQNPFSRPSTTSFTCRDINEDGILEFPAVSLLPGISSDVTPDSTSYLVEWRTLDKNGDFRAVLYAMMNPRENYWFQVPMWLRQQLSASNNTSTRTVTYTQVVDQEEGDQPLLGSPLFSIRVFTRSAWESRGQSSGYQQLAAQGDLVYGIQSLTQDDSGQRVIDEVRENFRLLSES